MIAMGEECVGGWVTKIAAEKIEPTFSIFSAVIFVILFPLIAIAEPSNSQYCVLGVTKIVAKKIKDYEVGQLFFDIYRHLAELDDKAEWPRSMG